MEIFKDEFLWLFDELNLVPILYQYYIPPEIIVGGYQIIVGDQVISYPKGWYSIIYTKDYIYVAHQNKIDVWNTNAELLQEYRLGDSRYVTMLPYENKLYVLCGRYLLAYDITQSKRFRRTRLSVVNRYIYIYPHRINTIGINIGGKKKVYSILDNQLLYY